MKADADSGLPEDARASSQDEVTRILSEIEKGDPARAEQLLPLVYEELRRLARARLARQPAGQTLQGTALVHEAYLRLAHSGPDQWNSRGHFFAAAAESMRRIVIDNIRRKGRQKRGGDRERVDVDVDMIEIGAGMNEDQLVAVNDALDKLEAANREAAELVKLRFFAGLTLTEAGELLGLSERTSKRRWAYARAWLFDEIKKQTAM